jgi:recombination protein RecA
MTERKKRPAKKSATPVSRAVEQIDEPQMVEPGTADVRGYLSTGSTQLDLCIAGTADPAGRGGVPEGRITEIFGPESSGKTFLAGEICGSAQAKGFDEVHLIDIENAIELTRAHLYGLNVNDKRFHFHDRSGINTIEDLVGIFTPTGQKGARAQVGLINRIARQLNPDHRAAVVADSITALPSAMEMKGTDKRGQSRSRSISGGFRTTWGDIASRRMAVVFVNQARVKPDDRIEWGRKRVIRFDSTGGMAIKHYPSVRVYLEEQGLVTHEEKGPVRGVRIWAFVYKNKVDIPFRECHFTLDFTYGIDDLRDNITWLRQNTDKLGLSTQWFSLPGRKKIQNINDFIKYIEDADAEAEVAQMVRECWITLNKPDSTRKPRKRGI